MPQIKIRCTCGEQYHVDASSGGGKIACRCGRTIKVRRRQRQGIGSRIGSVILRPASVLVEALRNRAPVGQRPRVVSRSARLVGWASRAYLGVVCLIAALIWGLGDRWWPATTLLFFGRWTFLLPLALLVPVAVFVARRQLVTLALGALVVVGPIMGFHTGWRRLMPAPTGSHFRIVSFNADGGELLAPRLPEVLTAWHADIIALQECGDSLAAAAVKLTTWYQHEQTGLCMLSRFPIRQVAVMDRKSLEAVRNSGAGIGGSGVVIRYTLETPAGMIQLTNLHLETPRKGFELLMAGSINGLRQNTDLRDIESDLARRWVDQGVAGATTPFLVAGDFNTPAESRIFQSYWSDLPDAFSRAGVGFGMTKYNGWIRVRIDHVLLGPGWHADHVFVGEDEKSDHRPLIADLTLSSIR